MKKDNQFINLFISIIIPTIILTKFSKDAYLGPVFGLMAALSLPLIYGLYELIIQKRRSFISILGFVSILLTGVIGLWQFPPHWIAVKESAIPLLIGLVVLTSTRTSWQIVKKLLFNGELFDIEEIELRINSANLQAELNRMLNRVNTFLAASFLFSATLNYFLAKTIVQSLPGTIQFNEEIGRMTMLSYPVIAIPSVAIMMLIFWYMIFSLKKLTQLSTNELFSKNIRDKA